MNYTFAIFRKPFFKQAIGLFLIIAIPTLVFSHDKSIYKTEFKNVGKNSYTKQLISLSSEKIDLKWNNYKGGAINTTDSLFNFGNDKLNIAFPTNSATHTNTYLIYYFSLKSIKCPTLFSLLNYYEPTISKNLTEHNLPQELKLLPAVLSAFNPNSNNNIGGAGYWHLNYPQAVKYGLTVNDLIDERKDFEKSTKAATTYLKDLQNKYNDWELTLTAYSSGVVTVERLLKRHNAKTYKEIYPYLPEETKDLVQAFVAMNYIYNYDSYGTVKLNPTIAADTVLTDRTLKFEAINHVLETSTKELSFYNPILNKSKFPEKYTAYLPKDKGEKFTEFKDTIYFYQDSVLLKPKTTEPDFVIPKEGEPYIYTVRSGDVLGLIAERNNVRVSQLQAWNNLSGTRINIGQKLTIYGTSKKAKIESKKIEEPIQKPEKKVTQKTPINEKKNRNEQTTETLTVYTVKSGDNLWIIAKKYSGVSAQNIMDYNGIDGNLTVGQKINIPNYK
ncbi:MAG: LysM peptidoglycan-binding domain-containing protein [Vicingaceae bacterium]